MFPVNVPNVLTLVRILLVPVLVVALLEKTSGGDLLAAVVFAAASVTDAIDGYIARSQGSITTFGKLMDPIADKLLIVAALVALVSRGKLEAWVAMVIIAREFAVTALRAAVGAQQGTVISASALGDAADLRHGADHRALGRRLLLRLAPPAHGSASSHARRLV
jgi:CDP-diacylglycerol--glycerol-3-phosphate 3-phosphatidyltransferase